VASWEDLVTTALLGTDRRPVPAGLSDLWSGPARDDPAETVLGHAARHRAAVRAGARPGSCPPLGPAPEPAGEPAPPAAQQAMADCLLVGDVAGVNKWLAEAAVQGRMLSAEHWTAIVTLAATARRVDRAGLARALGERGLWFVDHNPRWARLATSLRTAVEKDSEG
jgi:hypothetical protein